MDLFSNGLLAQLVERAPDNCVVVLGLWRGSSHINSSMCSSAPDLT
jgi:hypothetical protein